MLITPKSPLLPRNLALGTFGELLIVFSAKTNLLHLRFSKDVVNCLLKTFLENTSLDDSGISLPVFPSKTNLKLHISVIT